MLQPWILRFREIGHLLTLAEKYLQTYSSVQLLNPFNHSVAYCTNLVWILICDVYFMIHEHFHINSNDQEMHCHRHSHSFSKMASSKDRTIFIPYLLYMPIKNTHIIIRFLSFRFRSFFKTDYNWIGFNIYTSQHKVMGLNLEKLNEKTCSK